MEAKVDPKTGVIKYFLSTPKKESNNLGMMFCFQVMT